MRSQILLALSGLMLMGNVSMAKTLDRDDVPSQCWSVCGQLVDYSHKCDAQHDNDNAEMKCICDWNQASTVIPMCEACISKYDVDNDNDNDRDNDNDNDRDNDNDNDRDNDNDNDRNRRRAQDPHDNDAYDMLTSCSFTTTSFNSAALTTGVATTTSTGSSTTITSTTTSTGVSGGSSGSSSADGNSGSSSNSANNAQTTANAAPGSSFPKMSTMAAVVGLGALAWL